VFNCPFPQL
jgi:hypothetical protein